MDNHALNPHLWYNLGEKGKFMDFSKRLKEIRLEKGLNQKELAELSELSPQSISSFEKGINSPTVPSLLALANALSVSVDYILGRTDDLGTVITTEPDLSRDEREVLELYVALSPTRKEDLKIYLRALSGKIKKKI